MKTLSLTLVLVCWNWAALGQGLVQFRNYYPGTPPLIDAPVYLDFVGGTRLNASNPYWRAALLGGPTTATPASLESAGTLSMTYNPSDATLTWVNFRSGSTPPMADGYVNVGAKANRVVPGVNWAETALVQMVAWQGNYNTWAEAFAAWQAGTPGVLVGFSNPLMVNLPTDPTSPYLSYLVGLNSFSLNAMTPPPPYFNGFTGPGDETVTPGAPVVLRVTVDASPGPSFQWYFNGAAIPGATASTYEIPSVRPADAGNYYVVITHALGTYTTPVFTVTVSSLPVLASQPQSQTAVTGARAIFRVSATGDLPLSYQWYFNGSTPIGTGTSLKLTPLQPEHVGAYTVVVSNVWGAVTSAPAMLNVIPPVPLAFVPALIGNAASGTALNLEYANEVASPMDWRPLAELVMGTNTSQLYIETPSAPPYRFYRAWQTNGVTEAPLLSVHRVPAITLTGSVGSSVRVDCINQFGPTDAWVTLATVLLTDTSQVYFDTSAIGQPARLYRLASPP